MDRRAAAREHAKPSPAHPRDRVRSRSIRPTLVVRKQANRSSLSGFPGFAAIPPQRC